MVGFLRLQLLRPGFNGDRPAFGDSRRRHEPITEDGGAVESSGAGAVAPEILVVEPDPGPRDFVCGVLRQGGFRVECVETGEEILGTAHPEPPKLVILDVRLGEISGYEVCRALREAHQYGVLIMFMSADRTEPLDRTAGLLIGADDYLACPISADELLARVRALLRRARAGNRFDARNQGELTPRELEVLQLLADGLDQEAIARELVIAPKTVAKHIERILLKLRAHSRAEAVSIAYRRGLHAPSNSE